MRHYLGMPPSYVYQITKYDPEDRDERGAYTGPLNTMSDHGVVEAAYLRTVAAFAASNDVTWLAIREPEIPGFINFGLEAPIPGHGLNGLFPADLTGYHDGAHVPLHIGLDLVRAMLRDNGAWCRLEVEDRFLVHVGYDQYVYVGSLVPGDTAIAFAAEHHLFVERINVSPWAHEDDAASEPRPADQDFWAKVTAEAARRGAVLLQEQYVANGNHWYRIGAGDVDSVRTRLTPRARLAVWPDLSSDIVATLAEVPVDDVVEVVWQEHDSSITGMTSTGLDHETQTKIIARATAITVLADPANALLTAVLPDPDGVIRARWRI